MFFLKFTTLKLPLKNSNTTDFLFHCNFSFCCCRGKDVLVGVRATKRHYVIVPLWGLLISSETDQEKFFF